MLKKLLAVEHHRFPKDRSLKEQLVRKYFLVTPDYIACSLRSWKRRDQLLRKRFPVKYFLFDAMPRWFSINVTRRIKNIIEYIRYRTVDKYHVLKLDIEPGYRDPDFLITQAMFQVLVDFVEVEMAAAHDSSFGKSYRNRRRNKSKRSGKLGLQGIQDMMRDNTPLRKDLQEIIDLYKWWTVERPARISPYELDHIAEGSKSVIDEISKSTGITRFKLSDAIEMFHVNQDKEMMCRLSLVKDRLWY